MDKVSDRPPELTVIVNFYNMRREARRTLYTLTPAYQQGVSADRYRVVAIDNGSSEPLDAEEVRQFGDNFDYIYEETNSPSPSPALNRAIRQATTPFVMCAIDGARMLSPRVLYYTLTALQVFDEPFVYTIGMHLGEQLQNEALLAGYNQAVEDRLLETVDWRENGYLLFGISSLAASSNGFFAKVPESNCFAVRRETLLRLGGFDEGFTTRGGGLVNLDVFKQIVERPDVDTVALLGEATFHQFHGGVATNVPLDEHPLPIFKAEYERLRGFPYAPPDYTPHFWGKIAPECGDLRPQMPFQMYLEIGKRFTQNKQIEAAFAVYQQALERWSDDPHIHFAIGNAQRAGGDTDGAIATYQKALTLNHLQPVGVYVTLGNVYSDRGQLNEARKAFQQALDFDPDSFRAYLCLGNALAKHGELDEAIAAYDKAQVLNTDNPFLFISLGNAFSKQGKLDEAIAAYEQAQALNPENPQVHFCLGNIFSKQGKLDEAITAYEQAKALNPENPQIYVSLGNTFSKQGKLDETITAYEKAVALNADGFNLQFSLGSAYRKQGKLEAAIACFRKASTCDRGHSAGVYQNLADALLHQGETEDAIATCHKALELEPNRAHLHLILGNAHRQQEQTEDAIAAYQRALDLKHPQAFDLHRNLGELLSQRGETEKAIAAYEAAHQLKPQNSQISERIDELKRTLETPLERTAICLLGMHRSGTSSLAGSLQQAGLPAGEIDEWSYDNLRGNRENREIMVLNDLVLAANDAAWDNPPAQLQWLPEHQQRRDAIVAELDRHSRVWMFKEPRSVLTLPFWCEGIRDLQFIGIFRHPIKVAMSLYQRSQMPLRQGIQLWLDYNRIILDRFERTPFPLLCFDLSESEYLAQLKDAIETLNTQLTGQLTLCATQACEFYSSALVHQKSAISVHASDFEDESDAQLLADALALYRQLQEATGITIEETDADGWLPLAATVEACQNALQGQPSNPQLYFMLGNAQLQESQIEAAIASYQKAVELDPQYFEACQQLGKLLGDRERYDEAISLYQRAIDAQRDNPKLHWLLGNAEQKNGNLEKAIASHQKAIALAPKYTQAYLNLGGTFARLGQLDDTLECYRNALEIRPKDPQIHWILGNCERRRKNWKAAIESYKKALELNPKTPGEIYLSLAEVFKAQQKFGQAIKNYRKALEYEPKNPNIYAGLGQTQNRQGKLDAAISSYQKALEFNPPQVARISLELADILSKNSQIPAAIEVCKKAIELDSSHTQLNFILAGFQRQEGDLEAAIISYQKAIETNHDQPAGIYQNLADTLVKCGKITEAIATCQKAIELEPNRAHLYLILGNAYRNKNQLEEAIAAYQNAIELNHAQPFSIYKNLGEIFAVQGKIEAAILAYQEASKLQPKNSQILRCLDNLQVAST